MAAVSWVHIVMAVLVLYGSLAESADVTMFWTAKDVHQGSARGQSCLFSAMTHCSPCEEAHANE
jgi:hypothetical protein